MRLSSLDSAFQTAVANSYYTLNYQMGELSQAYHYIRENPTNLPLIWIFTPEKTGSYPFPGSRRKINRYRVLGSLWYGTEDQDENTADREIYLQDLSGITLEDFEFHLSEIDLTVGQIVVSDFEHSPLYNDTANNLYGIGFRMTITAPDDISPC